MQYTDLEDMVDRLSLLCHETKNTLTLNFIGATTNGYTLPQKYYKICDNNLMIGLLRLVV